MNEIPTVDWLLNKTIDKLVGEFNDRDAHIIVDVADSSPAAHIGLSTGDYLVSIDGQHSINDSLLEFLVDGNGNVDYQFYSKAQHVLINVTTIRLPLGFLHEPSSPGIVERYLREGFSGWDDFKREKGSCAFCKVKRKEKRKGGQVRFVKLNGQKCFYNLQNTPDPFCSLFRFDPFLFTDRMTEV